MKKAVFSIFSLILFLGSLFAQDDYTWWQQKHNWDGVTHWHRYMIISPGYLGPNALPVPDIRPAQLYDHSYLRLGPEAHFSKGDNTQNLFADLYVPIKGIIALRMHAVPVEFYKTDTLVRDERRSREYDPQGHSFGDIYFSTEVMISKNHKKWPDMMLGIHVKTASGDNVAGARFTDTPGYYFDLAASKTIESDGCLQEVTPFAQIGFYVWQLLTDENLQNDAFSFGAGVDLKSDELTIRQAIGGYLGYRKERDDPIVYRMELHYPMNERSALRFRFQQGIQHFDYTSVRMTWLWHLN